MRIAVVDIGTNSTRLLIVDVEQGRAAQLARESEVTRLGDGVDASGQLSVEAMDRVASVLYRYRHEIDAHESERAVAILTSAVRDAANGAEFVERVRTEFGLDARVIGGDEEARLTFGGATVGRQGGAAVLVVDIGGGSTELVVGQPGAMPDFHVSTQAGVVRQTERHLHSDPPAPAETEALADEITTILADQVPTNVRATTAAGIAVAGTATSCAAMVQELEPYDPRRVHGFQLARGDVDLLLARLAQMTVAERRAVKGLHPDRAPTIVAGVLILLEVMRAFKLETVEVSEHDILLGAALASAAPPD